jgi:hypothetical protein
MRWPSPRSFELLDVFCLLFLVAKELLGYFVFEIAMARSSKLL